MRTLSSKKKRKQFQTLSRYQKLIHSTWLFPVIAAIPLFVFTALGISGSSVGVYHSILYAGAKDSNLLLNQPQSIRSDEWLVNTQQTVMQAQSHYPRVNKNIGNGQDMSIIIDVPYKEWSVVFKPQNLIFFVLPLNNAFAFKWWLMSYLLAISCYFFVLKLLPNKKVFAACIATALLLSAFVQWWYTSGTFGSLTYSLLMGLTVMGLWTEQKVWKKILLGLVLAYFAICFALVLYPPFQIACALVLAALLLGYFIENCGDERQLVLRNIFVMTGSVIIAIGVVGIFITTRADVVKTIQNSAYPGHRSINSGGFYLEHFFSPHLGYQFLNEKQTAQYLIDGKSRSNQSEASNFLLISPFLFIPSVLLLVYQYRQRKFIDWPLLTISGLFVIFMLHLFVHRFTPVAKLLLLNQVAGGRLLIGMGLLNIILLVLFVRNFAKEKIEPSNTLVVGYCALLLALGLYISLRAHYAFGTFINLPRAILFSIPLPLVVYFLLKKRFLSAVILYLIFSVFIGIRVNPLYRGLDILTKNPLAVAISKIGKGSYDRWASQGGYLENVASLSNKRSLSGVYDYPQLDLWKNIPHTSSYTYNRYAHVGFQLANDANTHPELNLITADSFVVKTGACSPYVQQMHIEFFVTSALLAEKCTKLEKSVSLPNTTIYIYRLGKP